MNPWSLSATDLVIWGIILHLIADWPLQNDWMANNKMKRRVRKPRHGDGIMTPPRGYQPPERWWDRHPSAYVHAGIHGCFLALIFGWAAIPLAIAHLLIDTRVPIVWWGKIVGQTQPQNRIIFQRWNAGDDVEEIPVYDIGMEVRIWVDQVSHIVCIAVAALLVT